MLPTETDNKNCLSKRQINLHENKNKIINKPQEVISMLYISSKAPFLRVTSRRITLFRAKKISLVLIYAWLFMNSDPGYNHRVVTAMMMSRALSRNSLFRPFSGRRSNANSLSTIETIALIQAINSNNRGYQQLDLNTNLNSSPLRQVDLSRQQLEYSLERQLGPPLPRAAVVAAVAAFLTAVASGLNPVAAVAAAASAAAAALLIILISLTKIRNKNDGKGKGKGKGKGEKSKPLIKKLVIKKTVLPVVIPIVIKNKKEEEKIYKVYKKKPEHHHESKESKVKYKYKKIDESRKKSDSNYSLKQIENLLEEQNKLQSVVEQIIKVTESDNSSIKSNKSSRTTLDRRMGSKRRSTKRMGLNQRISFI